MSEPLLNRVEACYRQAEAFFNRRFPRPQVSLKLRGLRAGVAHLTDNRLRFNDQLYRENTESFLTQTVAHEVAHLIAHQLYGGGIRPHGIEWQRIMLEVYGLSPKRCHTYAVSRPQAQRHVYWCECAKLEYLFTAQRHALVRRGRRYRCQQCGCVLVYSGHQRLA